MKNIFHGLKPKRAPVLAFLLAAVMVIGIIPLTSTEAHAMTIDATSGGITWENGDSFTLHLFSQNDPAKTETHTVTYDGTKWNTPKSSVLPANAFAYIGEGVTVTSPTEYSVTLAANQSDSDLLANADVMIATGTVEKDSVLDLNFQHCFARLTFNITLASEFDSTAAVTEVRIRTKDANTPEVTACIDGNTVTALVTPDVYTAGDEFMEITVSGAKEPLRVKVPDSLTFNAGMNYEFDLKVGKDKVELPIIDLTQYVVGSTIDITENGMIIGDGNEYNITLNITEDMTLVLGEGTSGVKLAAPITVADGKTLTLLVAGDAEHTVNGSISLGNSSNVIIEGDLTKTNNKLTVTASDGNAAIGADNGVTAGDITIRNAHVEAYCGLTQNGCGPSIGVSDASMGNILIENSQVTARGGFYNNTDAAAAIGTGSGGGKIGNITVIGSAVTASVEGEGIAAVIGGGGGSAQKTGSIGDITFTSTTLNLSMSTSISNGYGAMIGSNSTDSNSVGHTVGKITFTNMTQAQLDEMIATWSFPDDFVNYGAYALGKGYLSTDPSFGGVYVSDGNGGTVQIGDADGYYLLNEKI